MAYLHVLAKLGNASEFIGLFADLTEDDLRRSFLVVRPAAIVGHPLEIQVMLFSSRYL
jgi:hypothetical protein